MNKSMIAVLNNNELLLVRETEPAALALLDEDAVVELHSRIRSARNKYSGLYRRGASARVSEQGGRGKARPKNTTAAMKAEVFEDALARVSRRLAALARQTAADLRHERIADAQAAKTGQAPRKAPSGTGKKARTVTAAPTGDRSLRSPVKAKKRAATRASGARRQVKRDSR